MVTKNKINEKHKHGVDKGKGDPSITILTK